MKKVLLLTLIICGAFGIINQKSFICYTKSVHYYQEDGKNKFVTIREGCNNGFKFINRQVSVEADDGFSTHTYQPEIKTDPNSSCLCEFK